MSESLEFHPKWYHFGDPDVPIFSVLYGAIALFTIYLLEYVSSRLLYSSAEGILLSDAAAQTTYSGASFIKLIEWFFNRPAAIQRRLCRRALVGIFLRYLILCADIGILYLSIPRKIDVLEHQVGTTQLSYSASVIKLHTDLNQKSPCEFDSIRYSGFTPKVIRQICVRGGSISRVFSMNNFNLSGMYVFAQGPEFGKRLLVIVGDTESMFTLTHSARFVQDYEETSKTNSETPQEIFMPIPENFVYQASDAFLELEVFSKMCNERVTHKNENYTFVGIRCVKNPELTESTIDDAVVRFLLSAGTKPVGSDNRKVVGSINRPRLCLIPSVVMVAGIISIAGLINLLRGTQPLAFKQWSYTCRTAKLENDLNPIFSEDAELQIMGDGSIQMRSRSGTN